MSTSLWRTVILDNKCSFGDVSDIQPLTLTSWIGRCHETAWHPVTPIHVRNGAAMALAAASGATVWCGTQHDVPIGVVDSLGWPAGDWPPIPRHSALPARSGGSGVRRVARGAASAARANVCTRRAAGRVGRGPWRGRMACAHAASRCAGRGSECCSALSWAERLGLVEPFFDGRVLVHVSSLDWC